MPKKNSFITVTDMFCGAGGSSQGVRRVSEKMGGGIEVKLAMNHWKLAIETHNTNFPDTLHDCTDISACDPRRYPSTDVALFSPECTTHTPAGGNNHKSLKKQMDLFNSGKIDPATERSRATMWDVCRFTEYHRYNIVIVENVVEAKTRWVLFDNWLSAMHALGYNHKCVYLNSMHCHPTPQSRDRMYVVFWKIGNRAPDLEFSPLAHCHKCGKDVNAIQTWKKYNVQYGKYRQQYVYCCASCTSIVEPYYYAAFNCIDWSDRGTRIGDRKKPLSPKSIKRINFGREKYGSSPYMIHVAYSDQARGIARSVIDPMYSQTTSTGQAIIQPFIVNNKYSSGIDFHVKGVTERFPTILTTHAMQLVSAPFIIKGEHANVAPIVSSATDPLKTQVTRQTMSLVTPPFITISKGQSKARSATDPINTQTTSINHGVVTHDSWNAFIASYNNGSHCTKHFTDELGTLTTGDRAALATYSTPDLEDFYYRMLKPLEVKLGMAFEKNYVVLGNGRDQVKQCGNAVTPPAMEWLVGQCVASLN
jgi:DNA (cytosine-5)-methyltransferase 1